jgi:hypothetical protein
MEIIRDENGKLNQRLAKGVKLARSASKILKSAHFARFGKANENK